MPTTDKPTRKSTKVAPTSNQRTKARLRIKKSNNSQAPKLDFEELLRTPKQFPQRTPYKSKYAKNDESIRKDVMARFEAAIDEFKNPQIYDNRLNKKNLSNDIRIIFEKLHEGKQEANEPAVQELKKELRLRTIIPYKSKKIK